MSTKFPQLKKYKMDRKNKSVSTNTFHIDLKNGNETVFMATESADNKFFLECNECNEELGEITDSNIEHQSEYHSCPVGTNPS